MKILLLGPAYPLRGGIAQFLARLHVAIGEARHTSVFHRFIRQYPKFLFPGKTQDDKSGDVMDVGALSCLDPLNPFNWPLAALRIAKAKPDVVVAKWWMPFFGPAYIVSLWLAKALCGCKVIFIIDNAIPHEKRPGDMLITRMGFGIADGFIVMSETVKADLLSIKPDANFILTPHPLYDIFGEPKDPEEAKAALGVSGPVLLFFGFIRRYKGLHILIEAMPRILDEVSDATLLIAGEFYEDKEPYIKRIKELGISDRVKVADGFIANEQVADYFSASDLLVLPYLSATQSGITQIAYVFGTPVVATRVGGLPEVVRDGVTGYLVEPECPDAVADAVVRYLTKADRAVFKAGIAEEKKRFSWGKFVDAIVKLARG
jgi:glycosyltransferase involved in cell wall biosynthesis